MTVDGGTISDLIREALSESAESAREYLAESWLAEATGVLRDARRKAGLTQIEVAERLATTQSSIARLENDESGGVTLRRFINYLLACGRFPLDVETEQFERVREYAITRPLQARHAAPFRHWCFEASLDEKMEEPVAVPNQQIQLTPDLVNRNSVTKTVPRAGWLVSNGWSTQQELASYCPVLSSAVSTVMSQAATVASPLEESTKVSEAPLQIARGYAA